MGMGSEGRVPPTLLCGAAAQVPDRLLQTYCVSHLPSLSSLVLLTCRFHRVLDVPGKTSL